MSDIYYDMHKEQCGKAEHSECAKTLGAAIRDFRDGVSRLKGLTVGTPWQEIAGTCDPNSCDTCEADNSHAVSVDDAERTYGDVR